MFKYKRVAIDFDGTLVEDSKNIELDVQNWMIPKALDGASASTKKLKELGFEILIFTCRPDYHRKFMEEAMSTQDIFFDYILFYTKPRVDLYIDDKGFRFESWNDTMKFIGEKL